MRSMAIKIDEPRRYDIVQRQYFLISFLIRLFRTKTVDESTPDLREFPISRKN